MTSLAHPKANRHDPDYYAWLGELCETYRGQCILTKERVNLVRHHVKNRSHGDRENVVLVTQWYHALSNDSYHALGSYRAFDKLHGTDSIAEAKRLDALYIETQPKEA